MSMRVATSVNPSNERRPVAFATSAQSVAMRSLELKERNSPQITQESATEECKLPGLPEICVICENLWIVNLQTSASYFPSRQLLHEISKRDLGDGWARVWKDDCASRALPLHPPQTEVVD